MVVSCTPVRDPRLPNVGRRGRSTCFLAGTRVPSPASIPSQPKPWGCAVTETCSTGDSGDAAELTDPESEVRSLTSESLSLDPSPRVSFRPMLKDSRRFSSASSCSRAARPSFCFASSAERRSPKPRLGGTVRCRSLVRSPNSCPTCRCAACCASVCVCARGGGGCLGWVVVQQSRV